MRRALRLSIIFTTFIVGAGRAQPAGAQGQLRATPPAGPAAPATSPFLRGVPTGTATTEPIQLTILDAVNRAIEHNLGVLTSSAEVDRARGDRWMAFSRLLPSVSGRVAVSRQKTNLEAFGFGGSSGQTFPGFKSIVGPFNVFDARLYVTQSVLNFAAINDVRSEAHNAAAAEFSYRSARDLVIVVTANAYLQALAAGSRAESARAQAGTAQALHRQAVDLKQAGLIAGIDVLRAQVQLNTQQQRVTAAENDYEKAKLQLGRIVGLPTGQPVMLTDKLPDAPVPDLTLGEALERAYKARPDYQAAIERVRAAEAARAAIIGDSLPSVQVTADYGDIGLTPQSARGTFSVVGAVNVPIFNGTRRRGRLLKADADVKNRQAEAEDMRAAIDYDIRAAFLDLRATGDELRVATDAQGLAAEQLTAARDRFAAGVASNIEVVQAQEAVALASEQYIGALYSYNVSKAALARGLGVAEDAVRQLLGGTR